MKTLWNMISRSGQNQSPRNYPEVEDDEMLFSKNNVCVHPCSASSSAPRHSLGYLTVTAAPHPALGHTLMLSWRPNQLMVGGGTGGRRGPRSLSETNASRFLSAGDGSLSLSLPPAGDAGGVGDASHSNIEAAKDASDVTTSASDVITSDSDVTTKASDVTVCNGVTGGDTHATDAIAPQPSYPAPHLKAAGASAPLLGVRDTLSPPDSSAGQERRLSTQSAPPSPQPRLPLPLDDAPEMFTMDLGEARSVRVFLTPSDPDCGQLVVCSRQSQYRILHFHCGGLERLLRLLDGWRHLRPADGADDAVDTGGCRLFSVCSPASESGGDHPEEGRHDRLTEELWHQLLTTDGRVTQPDQLRRTVFFGGLEPSLRPAVWPLLLGVLSCTDTALQREQERERLETEFERICALPDAMSEEERAEFQRLVVSTVDKDVVRTDPANPFFCGRSNPNVRTLRRVLLGFAAANPALGYTQGMSDLLAPLLVTLGSPSDAYWALDALIKRSAAVIGPRDDVMDIQLGYLRELLRVLTPEFHQHLAGLEDGLELLFTHRWLLLCFKREFAEPAALQIWESCWSCQMTRHFSLFVCAAICAVYAADVTESAMNADSVLLHFTSLSQHMDGELVLRKARGLLHQFLSLDEVPCSLAALCTTSGDSDNSAGPWESRRVAPLVCHGHPDGERCPAAGVR